MRWEQDLRQLARSDIDDPLVFLRALQDHPQVDGAVLVREDSLKGLSPEVLDRIFAVTPVLEKADPPALDQEADDHIAYLFDRFEATHILNVCASPRLLVALALPTLGTAPVAELELRVVQRMASLLAQTHKEEGEGQDER